MTASFDKDILYEILARLYHKEMPTDSEAITAAQEIMDLERSYVLPTYARYPLVLHRGKGSYVFDLGGKRYLDLLTGIGVNALGYGHPRILRVLREQAGLLVHTSNYFYHQYQGPLAKRLSEISGLQRTFFCNSGTEAMEGALKMIRSHGRKIDPEKYHIVALENSFHGRSLGSLSVTGQPRYRQDFEPLLAGIRFVPANDKEALSRAVDDHTAGIVIEWIQGEGGVRPLQVPFAALARELATRHNALMVCDEIQCGLGRPGTYFSYQLAEPAILPDIAVAAKPLACGLPLGAILSNEKASAAIGPGMHGTTFGGGPLACRVAIEFLDILKDLLPTIHRLGGEFKVELADLARHHGFIREVRGCGLMLGLELDIPGKQIVLDAMSEGLLINCIHDTVLRFLPPYVITDAEIDRALKILGRVLKKAKPA